MTTAEESTATRQTKVGVLDAANEQFAPWLEAKGWKIFTIIAFVYLGLRVLGMLMEWMRF